MGHPSCAIGARITKAFPAWLLLALGAHGLYAQVPIGEEAGAASGLLPARAGTPARSDALPPPTPVRTPAEWEEADALLLAWKGYPGILRQVIVAAAEEVEVIVLAPDTSAVRADLLENGVALERVSFEQVPLNSVWIRDYGPWSVYSGEVDSVRIIDWVYNRLRPADDRVPAAIARRYGIPLHRMASPPFDLVHAGGNFMTDGLGTGFSTRLVVEENWESDFNRAPKTEAMVDALMRRFMGIERYIKLEELPYESRSHLDMYMKLVDEETLLVGEFPTGTGDGPYIETNLEDLRKNHRSVFGTQYRVVRVPMAPSPSGAYAPDAPYRTYTNAVFVNRSILVPTYDSPYDTTALRIIGEALPGYRVVGIDSESIIGRFGAIHCITKLVHAADPLLISHRRRKSGSPWTPYRISARIQHREGIREATVWWTADRGATWRLAGMEPAEPRGNVWTATVPALLREGQISYYIQATANSGKTQFRPITAPEGHWSFEVKRPDGFRERRPVGTFEFRTPSDDAASSAGCFVLAGCGDDAPTAPGDTSMGEATVTITGAVDMSFEGVASFSVEASTSRYSLVLTPLENGAPDLTTRVMLQGAGGRPGTGTYQVVGWFDAIGPDASPSVTGGTVVSPSSQYVSDSGTLTITDASPTRLEGTVQLTAVHGFSGETTIEVQATFVALCEWTGATNC